MLEEEENADVENFLLQIEEAFENGQLNRQNPEGIRQFLEESGVEDQELLEELMNRFPQFQEREEKERVLKTQTSVIPDYLLKGVPASSQSSGVRSSGGIGVDSVQTSQPVEFVQEQILVKVRSQSVVDRWVSTAEQNGIEVKVIVDGDQPLVRIDSTQGESTIDLLQKYLSNGDVIRQQPVYVYTADAVPNDPFYIISWYHDNDGADVRGRPATAGEDIQSEDAWDISTGTGDTIVAVIDTGVMLNHEDLDGNLWDGSGGCVNQNNAVIVGGCPNHGWDFFDFDNDPNDEANHGTLVSGLIAAEGNNGTGVTGINWNGTVMALKAGTADSSKLSADGIIASIYFAVNNGAKIINMSFSSSTESPDIKDAIIYAESQGVLVIASAGNTGLDLDVPGQNAFPCESNVANIMCIAATNEQGTLDFLGSGSSSNYGATAVDIAAPGNDTVTTFPVQSDLYYNNFENGASDFADFTQSGNADWGTQQISRPFGGTTEALVTHLSGNYGNNESGALRLNQSFDLTPYESGTLVFEMSCLTDDTEVNGLPVDGVAIDFSTDGGNNFFEVTSYNGAGTVERGSFDVGFNGLPLITIGLIDSDFTSQFTFRYRFFSNSTGTSSGCSIDEVTLRVTDDDNYTYATGTSFAAPLTAGLASLMWDLDATLTYSEVMTLLINGGESLPALASTTVTGKRINAYRSLALMADPAVVNLQSFVSDGGASFIDGEVISSPAPHFTWEAPTGEGILTGYSFAVDTDPDAIVDTTDLFTTLSGLSDGTHVFKVVGVNDVGTTGTIAEVNFTVDTAPPTAPADLALNTNDVANAANETTSTLTGTASEDGDITYTFSDSNNPDVMGTVAVSAGSFSIPSINLSTLDEGPLSVTVSLTDVAGNVSPDGTLTVTKDTVVNDPTALLLNGGNNINGSTPNSVDLTFNVTETGSVDYSVTDGTTTVSDNVTVSSTGAITIPVDHTTLGNGTLDVTLDFTDDAGNPAGQVITDIDKDVDVFAVTNLQINGGTEINAANVAASSLTFDSTEAGNADYQIDNAGDTITGSMSVVNGSNSVSLASLAGLDEGSVNISVTFTDNFLNVANPTLLTATKDTVVTAASNVQLNGGNTIYTANETSVDLTFDTNETGSFTYSITDGTDSETGFGTALNGANTVSGLDVSGLDDASLTLSVIFTDDAGNTAAAGPGSVEKDTQVAAPTSVALNGGTTINSTTVGSVDLTFDVAEDGEVSYTISNGATSVNGTMTATSGPNTVSGINVGTVDDGTLDVSVTLTDTPGNVSTAGTANVEKDVVVNAVTNIQIDGGLLVNQANVTGSTLTFNADETGTANYTVTDGSAPNVTGFVNVTVPGAQSTALANLSGIDDGNITVTISFTDTAGNDATDADQAITKDTVVTAASNVQLNGGNTIYTANETSVDLTFDTTETGSFTYSITDGTDSETGFGTALNGANTVSGLDVSGLDDGSLTLSVTFTDDAGNTAAAGPGSVEKDTQVAAPTSVALNGGTTINSTTVGSVDLTFDVAEDGEVSYTISNGATSVNGTMTATSGPNTVSGINVGTVDDGTLDVSVTLTDTPGNVSVAGTATVEKDVAVNAVTNIQINGGLAVNQSNVAASSLSFVADETGTATYSITDGVNTPVNGFVNVTVPGAQTDVVDDLSGLDEGNLTITVSFTDTAGNVATDADQVVTKDTQVTAAANVALNGGVNINGVTHVDSDLTFEAFESGTADYSITDGSSSVTGSVPVTATTITVAGVNVSSLNNGNLDISVIITDDAGNEATPGTATVFKDAQVPNAPQNVVLNGGVVINSNNETSVSISGTVDETGTLLYAITDGTDYVTGSQVLSSVGAFSVTGLNVSSLVDTTLTVYVTLQDASLNVSADGNDTEEKDTQVAAASAVEINGGAVVNAAQQNAVDLTFSVAEDGNVDYQVFGTTGSVSGTQAVTNGANTISLDIQSISDGPLTLSVTFTDDAGNTAAVAPGSGQKDVTVVAVTNVELNGGVGINAADQNDVTLSFDALESGSANYTISNGGSDVTGSVPVSTGANSTQVDVSGLADGLLSISVEFTDAAGNTAAAGLGSETKDAQVAPVTAVQLNAGTTINASTEDSVDLTFTTSESGSVSYTITGTTGSVTATEPVASGAVSLSGIDVSGISDGTLSISVEFTDDVGNVAAATPGSVEKDTQVAAVDTVVLNGGVTINNATAGSVNLTFNAAEDGQVDYVISDGSASVSVNNVAVTTGANTISNIDVSGLADGTLTLSVVLTDDAGNVAAAGVGSEDKDTLAPQAPSSVQLNGDLPIGVNVETAVTLTGTVAESGSLLYAIIDDLGGGVNGQLNVSSGAFSIPNINVSGLVDGDLDVYVTLTDAAENTSLSGETLVVKDTVVSAATDVQLNGGTVVNSSTEDSVSLTFTTTEAGTADYVVSDGVNSSVTGSVTVTGAGTTTVPALDVSGLNDGLLDLSVTFTDSADNQALVANATIEKDTEVVEITDVVLNGGVTINNATADSVDLTFTADEDGEVDYSISIGPDDVTVSGVLVTAGSNTISLIDVSGLGDGTLNIEVTLTDDAGNTATAGVGSEDKDTQVAVAQTVALNNGVLISSAEEDDVDLTFDVTESGTVDYSVSDGTSSVTATAVSVSTGANTIDNIDVSGLADETLNISVTFTDDAGNTAATAAATVEKDATANAPTNVQVNAGQPVNLVIVALAKMMMDVDELGTIDYTFTDGDNNTVSGSQAATVVGNVNVINIDLSSMIEGDMTLEVQFTDQYGNVSNLATSTVTKDTIASVGSGIVLNGGGAIDNNTADSVSFEIEVNEAGTINYQILDEDNNSVSGTVNATEAGTITVDELDLSGLSNGLLTPVITFVDLAGNDSGTVAGQQIQKVERLGGGRRRGARTASSGGSTGTEEGQEESVEIPAPVSSGGGGGGGSSSGQVLGVNTTDDEDSEQEEVEEVQDEEVQQEETFSPFNDLDEQDSAYEAATTLFLRGIVQGQGDSGNFDPNGVLDRAQALKMLLALSGIEIPEAVIESPFIDVAIDAWFAPYIARAKELGFVNGYADGSFIPWRILNRAEALVLAYRILGVQAEFDGESDYADVAADVWFAAELHDAVERGLLSTRTENGEQFANPTANMTRAEFAILIVDLFENR